MPDENRFLPDGDGPQIVCDGCGSSGLTIQVVLGRDYFGRPYDRLLVLESTRRWYCPDCSAGKILQRDHRDIEEELRKLEEGKESLLADPDRVRQALLRLDAIGIEIDAGPRAPRLLDREALRSLRARMARHAAARGIAPAAP